MHAGYNIEVASYGVRYVYTNIQLVPELLGSEPKTVYRKILHTTSERDFVEFKQSTMTEKWQIFFLSRRKSHDKKNWNIAQLQPLGCEKSYSSLKCLWQSIYIFIDMYVVLIVKMLSNANYSCTPVILNSHKMLRIPLTSFGWSWTILFLVQTTLLLQIFCLASLTNLCMDQSRNF